MRIISMLFVLCLLNVQVYAGKISGKVSDEKTGEAVIGATVLVKGSVNGTATDVDGNFMITVDPGVHTLEIKYIGYQTKEVDGVEVKGSETVSVNIVITEATSTQLSEVVVRSSLKKENISALYVMQKNSISVSSGISADIIQRSPDRNTGEVLKRVSGASIQNNKFVVIRGLNERYNASMINGAQMQSTEADRKAFSYDVIPSNLIDNIIINKTASADLPGDFAGGVVQVLTKDVPENNFFNVGLSLGYNSQATFNDFYGNKRSSANTLGFSDKNNDLPSGFLSDYRGYKGLPQEQQLEAARSLGNKYPEVKSTGMPNANLQLSWGDARNFKGGKKLGTVIGVVYRNGYSILPDYERGNYQADGKINSYSKETSYRYSSSFAALANFAYVTGNSKITFRNLFNTLYDNNYYQREGFSVSSVQQFKLSSSVPNQRRIYSGQLEGDHALGKNNIKLYWNLNYANLNAEQPDLRTIYYSRNGSLTPDNRVEGDESSPFTLTSRNTRRFFSNLSDNNYGGNFYLSLPFNLFNQKQTLKFGYLGSYKDREFTARTFQYNESINFNSSLATLPFDEILADQNISATGYELTEITNPDDAYKANSMLNAGYVMLDNHLSEKIRVSYGVRFESYTQKIEAFNRSGTKINKTDAFNDILPSINFSYSPTEKTKVRLSGSRTVNRPEFRELAPFQFIDYENNWTLVGNPDLKRANITNVDLRYEYYPSPGEAITVGAFYKNFENPIESKMNDQSNYDLLIFGYQNAPSANAIGAELEVRKNLSFVSDAQWLERLIVGGNFTYVHSRVDVKEFGITEDRPLQGQSPYLVNFSILYNDAKTGLGFSALYNRIGERISVVGKTDIPNIWEKARNVVDFQVSKSLFKKRGELKFTVSDLLNQQYLFYWNFDKENTYNENNDRTFQKYKMGTSFTLGFTYRLSK